MAGSDLSIRPMTMRDLDGVCRIENVSFDTPWSREAFEMEVIKSKAAVSWIAEREGVLVGYLISWLVVDELHIGNVAVDPDVRGEGIGAALVEASLGSAAARGVTYATLEVRVSNEQAIALYERFSFRGIAMRARYYSDTGEDALVMMRELSPEDAE